MAGNPVRGLCLRGLSEKGRRILAAVLLVPALIVLGQFQPRWLLYEISVFYCLLILLLGEAGGLGRLYDRMRSGPRFWRNFMLGLLLQVACVEVRSVFQRMLFWNTSGQVRLSVRMSGLMEMIIFTSAEVLLIPLGEELFFRKTLVNRKSPAACALTSLFSFTLYTCLYARGPVGILDCAFRTLPYYVLYGLTGDLPLVFLVHLCGAAYESVPPLAYAVARYFLR